MYSFNSMFADLNENDFHMTLDKCRKHLENYIAIAGNSHREFSVFELGTGWYPIIPIGMYLCGASRIWTLDIRPFLTTQRVHISLQRFCESAEQRSLACMLPWVDEARLRCIKELEQQADGLPLEEMLKEMEIYRMVGDARKVKLPPNSIDLFFSNSVLQHIREDILEGIFTEFRRLAAGRAVMSHYIYLGDPFFGFDPTITIFNFLRFSGPVWKLIDNPLKPHSRLLVPDYRRIHGDTGWGIQAEENISESLEELRKVPLAKDFQGYSEQDLLVVRSWLTSSCA
jgi:hypothetical protein